MLAVYADGTCDVELDQGFLERWEHLGGEYCLPGVPVSQSFNGKGTDPSGPTS